MFAKTIIDSDAFLDMPLSTQALYFHLSMRADDEGFINNPKKIQRMIGATQDDLKLLISKNFIIPFESGVVVIKHWKIHNYIRGDRLTETQYQDEKSLLTTKENGAYTITEDIKEIQMLDANDKRKMAYQNSSLPYSFTYKIRRAFEGCTCPSCGSRMTSSCKNAMPTVQHNVPISKGGEHELENISVICKSCNVSIRDKATEDFNNAEVIEKWDKIKLLEKRGIDWFSHPEILNKPLDGQMSVKCQSDVSQMSDTCQSSDRIGKDRIGEDSIGEDSIDKYIGAKATQQGKPVGIDRPKTKPRKKEELMTVYYPNDEVLNKNFADFVEARNQGKHPFHTNRAIELAMKKLDKLSGGDNNLAIEIIEQSIIRGWESFYPIPSQKTTPANNASRGLYADLDEWLAKKEREEEEQRQNGI